MEDDSIWETHDVAYFYDKILNMLTYRGWMDSDLKQQAKEGFDSDSDSHTLSVRGPGDIVKVKVVINLSSEGLETSYIDSSMKKEEGTRVIFVYNHDLVSNPKLKFKNYDKPKDTKNHIEIHSTVSLILDIVDHCWSCLHSIADRSLGIFQPGAIWDSRLLPTIYHSDPQVRYIGARFDDIIKIVTEDQIKYRKVVMGYSDKK